MPRSSQLPRAGILAGLLLGALLHSSPAAAQAEPLRLEGGDRLCLLGGSLAERMQHHGWLETRLQLRFPRHELSFRNLGFSADELDVRQRTAGFLTPDEYLTLCEADVVLAFFGFNESFAGEEGLEAFRAELRAFVEHTRDQAYDGEGPPELVLFTPTAYEERDDPSFPRGAELDPQLELYSRAMVEEGAALGVRVVDLFSPTRALFEATPVLLTIDGIHFSEGGDDLLADLIEERLFGARDPGEEGTRADAVRETVLEKNLLWFNRYRATDGYNVYGGRSTLKYVDDLSNYTVLQRELEVLDAQAANLDRRIWELARGDDVQLERLPVPPQIVVETNSPGPEADGAHAFQSGEVAITSMTVPEGLVVELFADEERFPELVNPVQMAWDPAGRLWVAVWPTYPHWRPGDPLDDKLLILEDEDGDGRADRCTTFAGGLHNPTGFEHWMGGVFLANAPDLLFLEDTDGDDRADRTERVLGGLSSADTHHAANSFVFGPDGALYFQEGTFHMSQVETIHGPVRNRNGCVWRFEPRTFRAERYIPYNFANPHGHVFDRWGQDFVTDGTGNANYFALPFSGHVSEPRKHGGYFTFFAQNTRPAAATELLVSEHFPAEYQGNYLIANVIGRQGILRYEVHEEGSGFGATELEPLVMSSDRNFRPVDVEVAPDGSVFFLDWQNPLIGHMQHHLRDPSRDGAHGRVYRIRHAERELLEAVSTAGRPVEELLDQLLAPQDRLRYRARIELSKHDRELVVSALRAWLARPVPREEDREERLLQGLWVLQQFDVLDRELLSRLLHASDPRARAAATRVLRQMRHHARDFEDRRTWLDDLDRLVADEHPRVRLEAVIALSFFPEPRAAELALRVLEHPTDRFLDYALGETIRELEPGWRAALVAGEELARDQPAGLRYLVERLDAESLLALPGGEAAWNERMRRHDFTTADYVEAADGLAALHGTTAAEELLGAIERTDEETHGHVDHRLSNLFSALGERDDASRVEARLDRLVQSSKRPTTRRLAVLARLRGGRSVEALWRTAEASPGGLAELFDAATLVDDPALAEQLFPRILERFERAPEGAPEVTRGRYVRIELPGPRRTLTLAEVEVFARGENLALGGSASQSATRWGGVPERGVDGNRSGAWADGGQTHTPEDQPDPWWEVDLGAEREVERISLWNRTDQDGVYASRLDDFVLSVLDGERRTVFRRRVPRAELTETVVEVLAPRERLRRLAVPALARLGGRDPQRRSETLSVLMARFDDPGVRDEVVAALTGLCSEDWPEESRLELAERLTELFGDEGAVDYDSPGGRRLLALADALAPRLDDDRRRELLVLRGRLGPRVILIRPVPDSLLYDVDEFSVLAGRPIELVFENTDIMPHNLVVTAQGALAAVGRAGEAMASDPDGWTRGYVPDHPAVLVHTGLLQPGQTSTLSFDAPEKAGDYPYVCTFPGHWIRMNGVMRVVDDPLDQVDAVRAEVEAPSGGRPFVANWKLDDFEADLDEAEPGSAQRGLEVLEAASCLRCHRVEEEGQSTGPPLRTTVAAYDRRGLLEQILEPSRQIAEGYQAEVFILHDGEILAGIVLAEDEAELHLQDDPYRDDFLVLGKDEIHEREPATLSTMPEGLLSTFERHEVLDLLAFLESLREADSGE